MRRPRLGVIQLSAMVAALLMSTGLVLRISATLSPVAPETRQGTSAGRAIVLRDGANGVTLFDEVALAPGQASQRCLTVRATGTRMPGLVTMSSSTKLDPRLGEWLTLLVERGAPLADDHGCRGFEAATTLLSGSAGDVMGELDAGVPWNPLESEAVPGGYGTTYRLTAALSPDAPNEIQGTRLDFDLAWETNFDRAGEGFIARTFAVAVRFSEDSMIPMLAILSLAILFLGVQDRLDTATPRLQRAALFDETVDFE